MNKSVNKMCRREVWEVIHKFSTPYSLVVHQIIHSEAAQRAAWSREYLARLHLRCLIASKMGWNDGVCRAEQRRRLTVEGNRVERFLSFAAYTEGFKGGDLKAREVGRAADAAEHAKKTWSSPTLTKLAQVGPGEVSA